MYQLWGNLGFTEIYVLFSKSMEDDELNFFFMQLHQRQNHLQSYEAITYKAGCVSHP
jgi:hypothetical protein